MASEEAAYILPAAVVWRMTETLQFGLVETGNTPTCKDGDEQRKNFMSFKGAPSVLVSLTASLNRKS